MLAPSRSVAKPNGSNTATVRVSGRTWVALGAAERKTIPAVGGGVLGPRKGIWPRGSKRTAIRGAPATTMQNEQSGRAPKSDCVHRSRYADVSGGAVGGV